MKDQKDDKANEQFLVVDENDNPLDPLPRRLVHGYGVWHRVSHLWILDGKGHVLCQQRSLQKELNPGMWESFFGGHLRPDETYISGARREVSEEIGLKATNLMQEQIFQFHDPSGYNNEFQGIFSGEWNGNLADLHFDDGEVERVKWVALVDVLAHLTADDREWTNCGYEAELIKRLLVSLHN
jgi:16S rRNA (adenine1518-N6/adenine1519-N6)-dimethyltransferase